jgi:hypothetical protein
VLAYAITWSAQVPAYLYAHEHGHQLTNEQNLLHLVNLFRGELDPGLAPLARSADRSFMAGTTPSSPTWCFPLASWRI